MIITLHPFLSKKDIALIKKDNGYCSSKLDYIHESDMLKTKLDSGAEANLLDILTLSLSKYFGCHTVPAPDMFYHPHFRQVLEDMPLALIIGYAAVTGEAGRSIPKDGRVPLDFFYNSLLPATAAYAARGGKHIGIAMDILLCNIPHGLQDDAWSFRENAPIRFLCLEEYLADNPTQASYYVSRVKGRVPSIEANLLESATPQSLMNYHAKIFNHDRWPEAEPAILSNPDTAVGYANRVGMRFKEYEGVILSGETADARSYIRRHIMEEDPDIERFIESLCRKTGFVEELCLCLQRAILKKRTISSHDRLLSIGQTYCLNTKKRLPYYEDFLLKNPGDGGASKIVEYAIVVIKGRWPEAEKIIAQYAQPIHTYCSFVNCRVPDAEPHIVRAPSFIPTYALFSGGKRIPEMEHILLQEEHINYAMEYWQDIMFNQPWPELEALVEKSGDWKRIHQYRNKFTGSSPELDCEEAS